jgi:alanine dehydrogenase
MQITVKIVNVFDRNLDIDLPNHLALINLFDPNTGVASCVMDGTYTTGIRTAASAVLSARMLSRELGMEAEGSKPIPNPAKVRRTGQDQL